MSARRKMATKGFTLVEILIVVVILGILAAIVIPQFTSASESAKHSSLVSQLQTIRSQLELYQVQHNGNYPDFDNTNGDNGWSQLVGTTDSAGLTTGSDYGPYLQQAPKNPFNNNAKVATAAASDVGWVWDSATNTVKALLPNTVDTSNLDSGDYVTYAP